jgi:hypothetical protein
VVVGRVVVERRIAFGVSDVVGRRQENATKTRYKTIQDSGKAQGLLVLDIQLSKVSSASQ